MKHKKSLIEQFANAVISQRQCIGGGDAKKGNEFAASYIAAAKDLLAGGEESIESFSTLLVHADESVRCMAAAFLLKSRTSQAVEALTPIAKGGGLNAVGAQETLKRFEGGDLEIR